MFFWFGGIQKTISKVIMKMSRLKGIITFIMIMLLNALPLPITLNAFRPDLFLVWLIIINYNSDPRTDCLCYSWVIGMLANVYYDLPLGSIAIIYVSLSYIFGIFFSKGFSLLRQNIFIVASIVVTQALMLMLAAGEIKLIDAGVLLPGTSITVIGWYCYVFLLRK